MGNPTDRAAAARELLGEFDAALNGYLDGHDGAAAPDYATWAARLAAALETVLGKTGATR